METKKLEAYPSLIMMRVSLIQELKNDSEWFEKVRQTKTLKELGNVLRDFCKAKGYKVGEVDL